MGKRISKLFDYYNMENDVTNTGNKDNNGYFNPNEMIESGLKNVYQIQYIRDSDIRGESIAVFSFTGAYKKVPLINIGQYEIVNKKIAGRNNRFDCQILSHLVEKQDIEQKLERYKILSIVIAKKNKVKSIMCLYFYPCCNIIISENNSDINNIKGVYKIVCEKHDNNIVVEDNIIYPGNDEILSRMISYLDNEKFYK